MTVNGYGAAPKDRAGVPHMFPDRPVSERAYRLGCRCEGCAREQREARWARLHPPIIAPKWRDNPSEPWYRDAACLGMSLDVFFPKKAVVPTTARRVCDRCPVKAECLQDALNARIGGEVQGVWGGTTTMERRKLRSA